MRTVDNDYTLLTASEYFFDTLPPSLVSKTQLELLTRAADFFPPIIRFALECRLNQDDQIDLQFCIRRDEDDLDVIAKWFQSRLRGGDNEYEKVIRFLNKWADKSSTYNRNIGEVFLELDVLPSGIKSPLLFFELDPGFNKVSLKNFSFEILKETLGENREFFSLFDTVIQACPEPAFIAYIGILFSRDTDALRVNIKKLPITEVVPFLQKIGYTGLGPELDSWISFVYGNADRVTLCIDIGEDVFLKIGFECFWTKQPPDEPYWRHFIETLNTHNPFQRGKIEVILNWDKEIFPGQINHWPEHLFLESLQRPQYEFTYLKKWISHLKFSYCPGKELELKAYLAYESLWETKSSLKKENKLREIKKTYNVKTAIGKGVDFLLSNQQQSGWWKDFHLSGGTSDEWVTAYVAFHLACLKSPKTSEPLKRAWKILKTRYRKNGGWGYNVLTPPDADSSIWTWLFAQTEGFGDEFPGTDFNMVKIYSTADDGMTTYLPNGPMGKNSTNTDRDHFNGWQIPHYCVTAAYALAGKQYAIDYLLKHQEPEGCWYSYWWTGPEYATALATEALFKKDDEKYHQTILQSVNWAVDTAQKELVSKAPNDFKLSLLLKTILCSPNLKIHDALIEKMLNYFLLAQQSIGCWSASAELRFPFADNEDHKTGKNVFVSKDHNKNFTTVTVLDALNKYIQGKFS